MDQNGNGNGQDMVTVLQQQFVQMPRSEAFRLGYIHPQLMMPSIGGVSGGIMAATPTVFAVQPQTSQLMTIGTNQIANQTQVVVQQRNCSPSTMDHNTKTRHFRFGVGTGSRK